MISQKNYETYFMLYADNELSAAECEAVLLFVEDHPAYRQEFDLMNKIKLTSDNSIRFTHKEELYQGIADDEMIDYRYEPDHNIVYVGKQQLYRVEKKSIVAWIKPMAIAASLLLMLGLIWLIKPSRVDNGIAKTAFLQVPGNTVQQNSIANNSDSVVPKRSVSIITMKNSKPRTEAAVSNQLEQKRGVENTVAPFDQGEVAHSELPISNELNSGDVSVAQVGEDDLMSSIVKETATQLISTESPDVYFTTSDSRAERKDRFRGIVRKINRFLGKDRVESDQVKYIKVANFQLAVAQ